MNAKTIYVKVESGHGSTAILGIGPNPLIKAEVISSSEPIESEVGVFYEGQIIVTVDGHRIASISTEDENDLPAYAGITAGQAVDLASAQTSSVISHFALALRRARNADRDTDTLISWEKNKFGWSLKDFPVEN